MEIPQHLSDWCDTIIILLRKLCAVCLRIDPHASELIDHKLLSAACQPHLPVKDRSVVICLNRDRNDQHDWGRYNDSNPGYKQIRCTLEETLICLQADIS